MLVLKRELQAGDCIVVGTIEFHVSRVGSKVHLAVHAPGGEPIRPSWRTPAGGGVETPTQDVVDQG